jgi:hypothetical protein
MLHSTIASNLRGNDERQLLGTPYYEISEATVLGAASEMAAIGNPMKGLAGGSRWSSLPMVNSVPLAIEFFNIGLGEFSKGFPIQPACT